MSDRYYPVAIGYTEYRIVLVEAEDAADARERAKTLDMTERWEDAEPTTDGGFSVADRWLSDYLVDMAEVDQIGPREACPECGAVARYTYDWGLHHADHKPDCSRHVHRLDTSAFWEVINDEGHRRITGWYVTCSCGALGFTRHYRSEESANRALIEAGGRRIFPGATSRDALDAGLGDIARAHADGKPHWRNLPLGLTEDVRHPDVRGRAVMAR